MPRHKYLKEGKQTQLTPLVMEHADRIRGSNFEVSFEGISAAARDVIYASHKTCNHIFRLPYVEGWEKGSGKERGELKDSVFRKRTLNDVLDKGAVPTCSDFGLLFRGLMVAQGFPVAYFESFHEDFILGKDFHGHVFGRAFYDGGSVIVNPGIIPNFYTSEENLFRDRRYVLFNEGLDSWDVGIKGYDSMINLRNKNLKKLRKKHVELCDATDRFMR